MGSDTCDICGRDLLGSGSTVTVDGETLLTCPACQGSPTTVPN